LIEGERVIGIDVDQVRRANAENRARVDIDMSAGDLTVKSGAAALFEGDFEFNAPALKPTVAYAVDDDGYVGVPIDLVKPKASLRLQRERNLEADPRATLLVEHWDHSDWSRLWWVRAELRWQRDSAASRAAALAARLAGRYPQYQDQPFARVLVLRMVGVVGWAANDR